jgi:hypothetical protein
MKSIHKDMIVWRSFDERTFMSSLECMEHEADLLDTHAETFTVAEIVEYLRGEDDQAGLSWIGRACARMAGYEAPM